MRFSMTAWRQRTRDSIPQLPGMAAICAAVFFAAYHPGTVHSQNILWIKDFSDFSVYRLRGEAVAKQDLTAGLLKFYVSICTFPPGPPKEIRTYEIRKALYLASGITVMADLCNDMLPNAFQQDAFVKGYNSVMDEAITRRLGLGWKESLEKQVAVQLRKHSKGKLRARDIEFETPY